MKSREARAFLVRNAVLLLTCFAMLAFLNVIAESREAFFSPEVYFTDDSKSGLSVMPASCASTGDPSLFHEPLQVSTDGYGYMLGAETSWDSSRGAYSSYAGMYVCIIQNTSGQTIFIPARTAAELQAFKNNPPPGVVVY